MCDQHFQRNKNKSRSNMTSKNSQSNNHSPSSSPASSPEQTSPRPTSPSPERKSDGSKVSMAGVSSSANTSFRIDALLARQDPVRESRSPSSESESGGQERPSSSVSPSNSTDDGCRPITGSPPFWHARQAGHPTFPLPMATSSGMFSPASHPLYAAMYGSLPPTTNSNGGPSSAFHSPLGDFKSHAAAAAATSGLSMDWLARAGLLYHRTGGK